MISKEELEKLLLDIENFSCGTNYFINQYL